MIRVFLNNFEMKSLIRGWRVLLVLILIVAGCGGSSSTPEKSPVTADRSPATVYINASKGSDVSCTTKDGVAITLTVPPGALTENSDVSLSVTPDEQAGFIVTIAPETIRLDHAATLSLSFPEEKRNICKNDVLFSVLSDGVRLPLKQTHETTVKKATLYRFGTIECVPMKYDLLTEVETSFESLSKTEWQDALTLFNGYVWAGNYLLETGEIDDATYCFRSALAVCKESVEFFAKNSDIPGQQQELILYKRSLERYNYLKSLYKNEPVI